MRVDCELHLVTRDAVPPQPGVILHQGFAPNDPGLQDLFAACDIFVLPTSADCSPVAIMEAMASGLPVVCTRVGGIGEIVDHGVTGYLTPPGNGDALAERIEALVRQPDLRRTLGLAGRRRAEAQFDVRRTTARRLDLIRSACSR